MLADNKLTYRNFKHPYSKTHTQPLPNKSPHSHTNYTKQSGCHSAAFVTMKCIPQSNDTIVSRLSQSVFAVSTRGLSIYVMCVCGEKTANTSGRRWKKKKEKKKEWWQQCYGSPVVETTANHCHLESKMSIRSFLNYETEHRTSGVITDNYNHRWGLKGG